MVKSVFVSYSHAQGEWVWDRLTPVLKAGGAKVLIDHERFMVGKGLLAQMDSVQDAADVHMLVISPEYMKSDYCIHEMERAVNLDPEFERGIVVPIIRVNSTLPDAIRQPNPLYANLTDDSVARNWDLVLDACGADLGTSVPAWLGACSETRRLLERGQSVNLEVDDGVAWRGLVKNLVRDQLADLAVVDLEKPATASRRGLVEEILHGFGMNSDVPPEPEDLGELDRLISARRMSRLALLHFDLAAKRSTYGVDLFAALRYFVMESQQLTLLVQSRKPFATLVPNDHPLSPLPLETVELRSR